MYSTCKNSVIFVSIVLLIAPLNKIFSASGSTEISFDFTNIIILHYFSDAALTFTGGIDAGNDEVNASISSLLGRNVTFDASISLSDNSSIADSVDVTLSGRWAVRSLMDRGGISVQVPFIMSR